VANAKVEFSLCLIKHHAMKPWRELNKGQRIPDLETTGVE
jgi:hypothetical protein